MGLDDFKTEGPRTFSEDDSSTSSIGDRVVHRLKGTDPDTSMVPDGVHIHTVVCREMMVGFQSQETRDSYVCDKCTSTSGSFEAKLKVDKLDFMEEDWYDDFMEAALEAAEQVDREDTLDDLSLENRQEADIEEDEDDDPEPSSGLEAFKT